MRISHKLCIWSLAASMLLGTGAQAANAADPEQGGASVVQTSDGQALSMPQASDPENQITAAAGTPTTSSPPVHKLSVTTNAIRLDGSTVKPAGYNINDENYFKLRDIAYLMNGTLAQFDVGWDAATSSITLNTGTAYQQVGGEMGGAAAKPTIRESNAKVLVNGVAVSMIAYNINGNNYFRLRDVGTQIGFTVDYDAKSRAILLESPQQAPETYRVTFDTNGRGDAIPDKENVEEGSVISAPAAPAAQGYVFGGWYKDKDCTELWDFSKEVITSDITLYAKWTDGYTVTFNMNGHGTQANTQVDVAAGEKVARPDNPSASGYVFGGWYIESDCYTPWEFVSYTVEADTTLYAKWIAAGDADDMINTDDDTTDNTNNNTGNTNSNRVDGVMTILVDSGHGGTDGGTDGNGLVEKVVNLSVSQRLRDMLESAGATVVMSIDDTNTTLRGTDRMAFVRQKMTEYNFDLCISVHHNGGGAVGAEVFVQTDAQDPAGDSRDLGNLIIEEYKKLGQSSRGVKTKNLYMVRVPSEFGVPGILSEFCFLDNSSDAAKIDSPEEQQAEAQALYNAIMAYFSTHAY